MTQSKPMTAAVTDTAARAVGWQVWVPCVGMALCSWLSFVDRQVLNIKANEKAAAHLVLMLTKSKDGAWQVKDIDVRDEEKIEPRIKLYFEGRYNAPAPKP